MAHHPNISLIASLDLFAASFPVNFQEGTYTNDSESNIVCWKFTHLSNNSFKQIIWFILPSRSPAVTSGRNRPPVARLRWNRPTARTGVSKDGIRRLGAKRSNTQVERWQLLNFPSCLMAGWWLVNVSHVCLRLMGVGDFNGCWIFSSISINMAGRWLMVHSCNNHGADQPHPLTNSTHQTELGWCRTLVHSQYPGHEPKVFMCQNCLCQQLHEATNHQPGCLESTRYPGTLPAPGTSWSARRRPGALWSPANRNMGTPMPQVLGLPGLESKPGLLLKLRCCRRWK